MAATTAEALARLDAGGKHHPAFAVSPTRPEGSALGVPTFAQALRLCGELGLWVNAEIKPTPGRDGVTGRAVAAVAAMHLARQPATQVMFSSFSPTALQAAMATAPTLPRALLLDETLADWRAPLAACAASALHVAAGADPAALCVLRTLCARDLPVACYTVNDRETADTLFAAGITAIFTDRPDLWTIAEM